MKRHILKYGFGGHFIIGRQLEFWTDCLFNFCLYFCWAKVQPKSTLKPSNNWLKYDKTCSTLLRKGIFKGHFGRHFIKKAAILTFIAKSPASKNIRFIEMLALCEVVHLSCGVPFIYIVRFSGVEMGQCNICEILRLQAGRKY